MREILFRGKDQVNGEWISGFLVSEKHIGNWMECYAVITETVGQFTGLTDKNGKRIFEGDIVKADNGKQSSISVVKFGDYYPEMFYKMLDMFCSVKRHLLAFGFYAETIDKHEEMILFQSPCVEIIGNIHDNPELLEAADGEAYGKKVHCERSRGAGCAAGGRRVPVSKTDRAATD